MSTRSVIAAATGDASFTGVYHHWDGYPSALGSTLFHLARGRYYRNIMVMRQELIEEHPGGWSTINGADWTKVPGYTDPNEEACTVCRLPFWRHYTQYYESHGLKKPEAFSAEAPYQVYDHVAVRSEVEHRPECHCHDAEGKRTDAGGDAIVSSDGDDMGTEWAYVLTDQELKVYERAWSDGTKMIGMFGMGADAGAGTWLLVAKVPWAGPEPDWDQLDKGVT